MGIYKRTQRGRVTYYFKVTLPGDTKPTRRSLRTSNYDEAAQRYAKFLSEHTPTSPTTGVLHPDDAWQSYTQRIEREKKPNSLINERMWWRMFWDWSKKCNLYAITVEDVTAWRDHLVDTPSKRTGKPRAPHSINDALRNVCVVFSHLKRMKLYTGPNFFAGTEVKRVSTPKTRPGYLTKQEIEQVLAEAEKHGRDIHLVYAIGIFAGLRKTEMLNLRWKDIDWERRDEEGNVVGALYVWRDELHDTKTEDSQRVIPLHERLNAILSHYRPIHDDSGAYIIRPSSKKIGKKRYRWEFRATFNIVRSQAGVDCSAHGLRHTFGSQLAAAGVDMYAISKWMGHSSTQVTEQHYAHLTPVNTKINRI